MTSYDAWADAQTQRSNETAYDPEQVSVNVADLKVACLYWDDPSNEGGDENMTAQAFLRLSDVLPEPEWEITDDMRAKYRRAHGIENLGHAPGDSTDRALRALHREGLL